MTTTITIPEPLAQQLAQRATTHRLSVEALAIAYLTAALHEAIYPKLPEVPPTAFSPLDQDLELLALIARIKATPPNPVSIIPAKGNLAEVLRDLESVEDPDYDLEAEIAALDAAELELRALDRSNDLAEGQG